MERRLVARLLDSRQAVAGVGGEQPCEVSRLDEGGGVGECAGEVLAEGAAHVFREGLGFLQAGLKVLGGIGQPEGLQLGGPALGVLS